MAGETSDKLPLSERIAQSPIHQWVANYGIDMGNGQRIRGVEPFLDAARVPQKLRNPFHELLIERGQYGWDISDEEAKKFGKNARAITIQYKMLPEEAQTLMRFFFIPVVSQWMKFYKNLPMV